MPFVTQVEQVLACLLFAYLIGDTIVRAEMIITALSKDIPIQSYFKGWLSEKIFKDWYMFIGWDRVILAVGTIGTLSLINFHLVLAVFSLKLLLDVIFHLILRIFADRLF